VGYHLDEKNNWALDVQELKRSYEHAREEGIDVRALVLINPGNPTGAVLTRENLHDIVRFCSQRNLVLLADEVYQENVYDEEHAEFISCKRASYETGLLDEDAIELVSFHSTSKGVFGECGRRGGYMELVGFDPAVLDQIYKLASSGLCSSVSGQIMTSLMVRGPSPGDESFKSHQGEMRDIFESLKRRSKLLSQGLNSIRGFSCQRAQGSMYCFPSVEMPASAIKAADKQRVTVDTLYCLSLLEHTGICVVPASGFGQKTGRYGFRTTFLPSEQEMERVVQLIQEHHEMFCDEYSEYA
jgi:aspartate/methionine/tyrosine aminotransferase